MLQVAAASWTVTISMRLLRILRILVIIGTIQFCLTHALPNLLDHGNQLSLVFCLKSSNIPWPQYFEEYTLGKDVLYALSLISSLKKITAYFLNNTSTISKIIF